MKSLPGKLLPLQVGVSHLRQSRKHWGRQGEPLGEGDSSREKKRIYNDADWNGILRFSKFIATHGLLLFVSLNNTLTEFPADQNGL